MKERKLKIAFVDDGKRYSVDEATPEEIGEAIKELSAELVKRLKK
jgi:hypothetical protein